MRRATSLCFLLGVVGWPAALTPQSTTADFLALGIRQVSDGDFEQAVFTLDTVVRKLTGQPGPTTELVEAYVYLGAAYVGLNHDDAAKGKFREALTLDPHVRLSLDRFPPRVVRIFETQVLTKTAAEKKRGTKLALIVGGVGAAGAVGVAAATRGGTAAPANRPPTVTVGVTPDGQAIPGVTTMSFTASAADADGDALTYSWDFGDGSTGAGTSFTHIFKSNGAHRVTLTVADGKGGSATATSVVTARTLTDLWTAPCGQPVSYQCLQNAGALDCGATTPNACVDSWAGSITDPRRVTLTLTVHNQALRPNPRIFACAGEISTDLNSVRCEDTVTGQSYQFTRR